MKRQYKDYSKLLDAITWTGAEIDFNPITSDHLIVRHPEVTLWVEVPFVDPAQRGEVHVIRGHLSKDLAKALDIDETTWLDVIKVNILCTDFDWVPAPLWFLIVSPILAWAIEGDVKLFTWPFGRSKKPWRKSFWVGGFWDGEGWR